MAPRLSDDERKDIRRALREAVNMTPSELERWLRTDASKDAGSARSPTARWWHSLMNRGHDPLKD